MEVFREVQDDWHAGEQPHCFVGHAAGEPDVVLIHFGDRFLENGCPPCAVRRSLGSCRHTSSVEGKPVVDDNVVGLALEEEVELEEAIVGVRLLCEYPLEPYRLVGKCHCATKKPIVAEEALAELVAMNREVTPECRRLFEFGWASPGVYLRESIHSFFLYDNKVAPEQGRLRRWERAVLEVEAGTIVLALLQIRQLQPLHAKVAG